MMRFFTIYLAALILLATASFSGAMAQTAPDTVSIYDLQFVEDPLTNDQTPFFGDTVVVRGMVMNYPRDLWVGARWAVYIIDPDSFPNPWSGFFIIQHDTTQVQTLMQFLEPGMICNFTGLVDEFGKFSQMNIYGAGYTPDPVIPVEILSQGNPLPDPVLLTAADLENRATAEQWESMWVRVENATVVNNNISGNWASITDATGSTTFLAEYFNWFRDRLNAGTYSWPTGGTNLNVTGFTRDESGTPGQVFNINPRDTNDVEILSNPPEISNIRRDPGVPTSSDAVTVSATIVDNGTVQSALLHYSVDEAPFQQVAMTANGDVYSADIPAQTDGAFVRYFVSAEDNVGDASVVPGDTSRATGRVFFYTVRDNGLTIADLQNTHGYAVDISGYVGQDVTVSGVVMTDTTDETSGYWIQDAAAPWSGIWVNDSDNKHAKGDSIQVRGIVRENFTVTRLDSIRFSNVVVQGVGEYDPVVVTTGELNNTGANREAYESVLVRVENVTVTDAFPDAPSNFGEFVINDGSGDLRVDDLFDAFRGNRDSVFVQGQVYEYIIGFNYFSFGNYKMLPRDTLDIGPLVVGIEDDNQRPLAFELAQNYPNPFNPTTRIRYSVAQAGTYQLDIYNVLGQRVRTLLNRFHSANRYEVVWDGRNDAGQSVGSGIYIYKLTGQHASAARKMILLK